MTRKTKRRIKKKELLKKQQQLEKESEIVNKAESRIMLDLKDNNNVNEKPANKSVVVKSLTKWVQQNEQTSVRKGSESTSEDDDDELVQKINNVADLSSLSLIENEDNVDLLLFTQQQSPIQKYSSRINTPLIKSKTTTPNISSIQKYSSQLNTPLIKSKITTPRRSSSVKKYFGKLSKSSSPSIQVISSYISPKETSITKSVQKSIIKENINNEIVSSNITSKNVSHVANYNGHASSNNENEVHIDTPGKQVNRTSTRNKGVTINYNQDSSQHEHEFIITDSSDENHGKNKKQQRQEENSYIGREIKKFFPSEKIFYKGVVVSYEDDKDGDRYYKIKYIDDDEEEFDIKDLLKYLIPVSNSNNIGKVNRSASKQKRSLKGLLDTSEKWRSNATVSLNNKRKKKSNSINEENKAINQEFKKSRKNSSQSNKNSIKSNTTSNSSKRNIDPLSWISSFITPSVRHTLMELEKKYSK